MKLEEIISHYKNSRVDAHSDGCSEGYRFKCSITRNIKGDIFIEPVLFNMDTLDKLSLDGMPIYTVINKQKISNLVKEGQIKLTKPNVNKLTVCLPRRNIGCICNKLKNQSKT